MVFGIVFAAAVLVSGMVLLILSSDKAVEHSVHVASALGVSSLMVGLVLVSIGTDLPEMANSIVACSSGHGDINVGDSFGSILTQITLVLGLIAILGRSFKVSRREVTVMGTFEVLALTSALFVALVGFTRERAFLLIASWPIFIFIIWKLTAKEARAKAKDIFHRHSKTETRRHFIFHLLLAALGFMGVAIGAIAVVQSVILLSTELQIPEFFISFFALALGTSLPELVVDLTAIRKKQYEMAIGDIIGSCIVDATISISIGQFFFPTPVFVESASKSILLASYSIVASAVVLFALAMRQKVDRKAGALFICVYAVSYILLYVI
ncbi:MAG: sodium:calcium antiporter [Candidatus Bathyarchaeota archaeon]